MKSGGILSDDMGMGKVNECRRDEGERLIETMVDIDRANRSIPQCSVRRRHDRQSTHRVASISHCQLEGGAGQVVSSRPGLRLSW